MSGSPGQRHIPRHLDAYLARSSQLVSSHSKHNACRSSNNRDTGSVRVLDVHYFAEQLSFRHDIARLDPPGQNPAHTGLNHVDPAKRYRLGHDPWPCRVPDRQQCQRLAGEVSPSHEEAEQRLGIALRQGVIHIGLAPQLDGGRLAGHGQRVGGETVLQGGPQAGAGLVEGVAAGVGRQQRAVRADLRRQISHFRPQAVVGVHVHHRLAVAVQIQHDVGHRRLRVQHPLQRRLLLLAAMWLSRPHNTS
mmetsp:Transcript_8432/g.12558  ORF Transcript_8432/g.12558 Transcript_8432/m.12558 type:complete len:248 (+) Transcript_8432:70-813(+)